MFKKLHNKSDWNGMLLYSQVPCVFVQLGKLLLFSVSGNGTCYMDSFSFHITVDSETGQIRDFWMDLLC